MPISNSVGAARDKPCRILALTGGGVRGIFQATYLAKLAAVIKTPLSRSFDLIAGTSTGAILGLALALDVDPNRIVDFYMTEARAVFHPRTAAAVRSGPRYANRCLRKALQHLFGNRRLQECTPPVLITAASLDRFRYRIFSTVGGPYESDGELLATDVALASAAAPTFFAPISPVGQERSYVDGGVWANSPTLAAVLVAHGQLKIDFRSMRVLSVGNGEFQNGIDPVEFRRFRPLSFNASRTLFEIMFAAQESFADEFAMKLLPPGNFIRATTTLVDDVPLDGVEQAIAKLPALAEVEFDRTKRSVIELITPFDDAIAEQRHDPIVRRELVPYDLVEAAGLTGFYPSRAYYSRRDGASSIDRYIARARSSLVMVSINLMTGLPFDGILDVLEKKLESRDADFAATISLLNPCVEPLMCSVAPALDLLPDELARLTKQTALKLLDFRASLSETAQKRLKLRLHNALPFGSAILIDHLLPEGRIQIETKAYKTPVRKSFAFEVARTGSEEDLYRTLQSAYERLVDDGVEMDTVT